jgi:hypothetical protein
LYGTRHGVVEAIAAVAVQDRVKDLAAGALDYVSVTSTHEPNRSLLPRVTELFRDGKLLLTARLADP